MFANCGIALEPSHFQSMATSFVGEEEEEEEQYVPHVCFLEMAKVRLKPITFDVSTVVLFWVPGRSDAVII